MTQNKRTSSRLRHDARERMKMTGEKYTVALKAVMDAGSSNSRAAGREQGEEQAGPADTQRAPDDTRDRS
ncbi:hypothetical protein [Microbacterium schleiferi]|uniref:Uncharacterized protein n=1 Tax=Microbacterium schleiferi TaxID=69362 RepID=A0ABU7V488_9MICO